jgi:hypothetical protein
MGIARLLLVGLAILVLLALVVAGVLSLVGSLKSDRPASTPSGSQGAGTQPTPRSAIV